MTRHFLADDDLSPAEQAAVLDLAAALKRAPYDLKPLAGPRSVATIYDKPTLRTQVSFAAGIAELGGHPMLVDGALAGIGVRESVAGRGPGPRPPGVGDRLAHLRAGSGSRRWRPTRACPWSTRSPTSSTRASCWPTCSPCASARATWPG